jgi:anti-sigma factor ChrR (cupin superfamily)
VEVAFSATAAGRREPVDQREGAAAHVLPLVDMAPALDAEPARGAAAAARENHAMEPAPSATLTLPQLRELTRGARWRVVYVGVDDHLAVLEADGDAGRMISRPMDGEALAVLRACKAERRNFEGGG